MGIVMLRCVSVAQLPSGAWCKCGSETPARLAHVANRGKFLVRQVAQVGQRVFQSPLGHGHSDAQVCQFGTVAQWGVVQGCFGNLALVPAQTCHT